MLAIPNDSTYYPGPQLEFARGLPAEELVEQPDGLSEPVWIPAFLHDRVLPATTSYDQQGCLKIGPYNLRVELPGLITSEAASAPVVRLCAYDPWLLAAWRSIAAHRGLADGWDGMDGKAPRRECLDAAEALANLISGKPMHVRPQFAVDSEGRPSFASYDKHLYLHLTVDGPDRLSWYAVVDDKEFFEHDVQFDGVEIPAALNQLL